MVRHGLRDFELLMILARRRPASASPVALARSRATLSALSLHLEVLGLNGLAEVGDESRNRRNFP